MMWVVLAGAAWLVLSVVVGSIIGKSIRQADTQEGRDVR